jgi:excisionase family DNA binding protein
MEGLIREISVTEAAGRLDISRQRVLRLIRNKRLRARRTMNIYHIRESDLALVAGRPTGRPKKANSAKKVTKKQATKKAKCEA